MSYAEILVRGLGSPSSGTQPSPEELSSLALLHPPSALIELWTEHGFAGYKQGFYWTTDPRAFTDIVDSWRRIPSTALVIGRDAFANLYMLQDEEVWQLNIHWDDFSLIAPNLDRFFDACIAEPSFREYYMWVELFEEALQQHGTVEADECYGFFPALALGGAIDVTSTQRVKLYEHLTFLSQLHA